ncbi:MAG: winged helix-turn-helix transcriptional regulator [Methanoregula sp.]|uniref:winged helix-turn-helix transcriptional regulator n=1 Tax=Methanoregula sp. TaxID=2052170 RepID=UPI0025EB6051|nr:winged helix-turn-helix transcriptional regulator [Methanoregula sp.]MCK9631026.1 winged helix-turn-helix transcriptional regulator [Methanoregula sp.]
MDNPIRSSLIILSVTLFFLVPVAASALPGHEIIIEPGYDFLRDDPPDDVVKISFWKLSPKSMMLFSLLAISPILVYPTELFFMIRIYSLLGIRRLTKKHMLDHKSRKAIYELIRKNPGIQLPAIMDVSHLNRGTARYHLARLEIAGKITYITVSGKIMYYENNENFSNLEKKVIWHLKSDSRSKILFHLLESTASSRHEISDALGVTGPTVSWHMYRLIHDEITSRQKEGKFTWYGLKPEAVPVVRKYLPPDKINTPGMVRGRAMAGEGPDSGVPGMRQ